MNSRKKRTNFIVPNYRAKNRKRVSARWRKQRGTDNKKRLELKAYGSVPKIGYKKGSEARFSRVDGSFELLVHDEKELVAVSSSSGHIAVFAHGLSKRKRAALQQIADARGIKIANRVKQ